MEGVLVPLRALLGVGGAQNEEATESFQIKVKRGVAGGESSRLGLPWFGLSWTCCAGLSGTWPQFPFHHLLKGSDPPRVAFPPAPPLPLLCAGSR